MVRPSERGRLVGPSKVRPSASPRAFIVVQNGSCIRAQKDFLPRVHSFIPPARPHFSVFRVVKSTQHQVEEKLVAGKNTGFKLAAMVAGKSVEEISAIVTAFWQLDRFSQPKSYIASCLVMLRMKLFAIFRNVFD